MDRAGRRIEVLLEWRDRAEAAGHAVPEPADVMRIGASGEVRPDGVDLGAVEPWAATVEWLLRRFQFGDPDPVEHLPDELREPAPAPPEPAPPLGRAGGDVVLDALLSWWHAERAVDRGLRRVKEYQLRNIAATRSRTEAEVRRHLPAPLGVYAGRIAEVVARRTAPPDEPEPVSADSGSDGPHPAGVAVRAGGQDIPGGEAREDRPPRDTATDARADTARADTATRGDDAATRAGTATRPGTATRGEEPAADAGLADLPLADYAYTPAATEPVPVRRRASPTGSVLAWPPREPEPGRDTVLYRVVTLDDRWKPHTPQDADALTVTTEPRCVDDRPFSGPVRHVQVWVHAGRDREDAAAAEPVLHAQGVVVARVTDARVRVDGRSVVGQWRVPAGVESVEVLRVPRERARRDGHSGPEHRLPPQRSFATGFVDDDAERGHHYVYEMSVEVEVEGVRHRSDPTKVEVEVPAELLPVTDLRVAEHPDDRSVVELTWTTPMAGDVRIYRTRDAPAPGVEERPVAVADLPAARLGDDADVGRPVEQLPDGTSSMAGVPWLPGWTSAYFTPVTVSGERAAVGPSTLAFRLREIQQAEIVERTHRQIVTFAWPDGADAVLAHVGGPRETAEEAARHGHPEEISHAQYVAQGGMYVRERLPPRGCSVHLVPVAHSGGRRVVGPATSLLYPGLLWMAYEVRTEHDRAGRPVELRVAIRAEQEVPEGYVFTLVHHPDRLPLHERDGHPLYLTPRGDPRAAAGYRFTPSLLETRTRADVHWSADARGLVGHVRLFVRLPREKRSTVALFDPPVETLHVAPKQAGP